MPNTAYENISEARNLIKNHVSGYNIAIKPISSNNRLTPAKAKEKYKTALILQL
jgi:hypothetical protein